MSRLPSPATGVELYLAAVLEELRAIRVLLEDRHLVRVVDEQIDEKLAEITAAVRAADAPPAPATPPTRRTRTRTPRATT